MGLRTDYVSTTIEPFMPLVALLQLNHFQKPLRKLR